MVAHDGVGKVCIYQEPNLPFGAAGVAWPHSAEHWRPRHCHRELELNLVTRGRGRFALDTGEYELGRGDMLWFLPHVGHELVSTSADFDMWVVTFRQDLVERVDASCGGSERTASIYRAPRARLDRGALGWSEGALRSSFQLLCRGRAPEPALIGELLARLWRETRLGQEPDAELHVAARRARALLSKQPWLGRAELAAAVSVSESTLAHAFRRGLGVTLDEYRNRVRVGRLLELIEGSRPSLLDAGLAAGFGSSAQYHRSVRALAGCRPGELTSPEIRRALSERVRGGSSRSAH
jgi:AraC family transcriptional regulator